jgi:hypothetical protein
MLRTRVGRCGARCKPQGPSRSCGKDAAVEVVGSGAYLSILPCMLTSTNVRDMHEVIWADQSRRRNRHDSIGIPYHDSGRKNRGCVRHFPRDFNFSKMERKRDRESVGRYFRSAHPPINFKQMLSAYGKLAGCTVGAREPKLTI